MATEAEIIDADSLVVWEGKDRKIIMSVNDTKRGKSILKTRTPTLPQTERRRKWSAALAGADEWLQLARKDAKRRNYHDSRDAVLCAMRALEDAMTYEEPEA